MRYSARGLAAAMTFFIFCGCAAPKSAMQPPAPVAALATLMAQANSAHSTGQIDKANELLKEAASAYPADKMPWVRLAQIAFEQARYGDAIVHALEALERDSKDQIAHSLVAVSGLRLSSKALGELRGSSELSGSVRQEAQELARVLRESIGESVLVPQVKPGAAAKPANRYPVRPIRREPDAPPKPGAPGAEGGGTGNPFGLLR